MESAALNCNEYKECYKLDFHFVTSTNIEKAIYTSAVKMHVVWGNMRQNNIEANNCTLLYDHQQ